MERNYKKSYLNKNIVSIAFELQQNSGFISLWPISNHMTFQRPLNGVNRDIFNHLLLWFPRSISAHGPNNSSSKVQFTVDEPVEDAYSVTMIYVNQSHTSSFNATFTSRGIDGKEFDVDRPAFTQSANGRRSRLNPKDIQFPIINNSEKQQLLILNNCHLCQRQTDW